MFVTFGETQYMATCSIRANFSVIVAYINFLLFKNEFDKVGRLLLRGPVSIMYVMTRIASATCKQHE